jgi:Ca2+-binding EF-hand superfamily protein
MSTIPIMSKLINDNKIKKWNTDRVSIYEILCGMTVIAYANYFQKIRFIFTLFDYDGNQAIDINEISIMVNAICKGWSRFTGLKIPSTKTLEAYSELVTTSFSHS